MMATSLRIPTTPYLILVLAAASMLLTPCSAFSAPALRGLRSPPAHRAAAAAPPLRTGFSLSPSAIRRGDTLPKGGQQGVALNMDFYPGLGETEVAYDTMEADREGGGGGGGTVGGLRRGFPVWPDGAGGGQEAAHRGGGFAEAFLYGPTEQEVDRKLLIEGGFEGLVLYRKFTNHLNKYYAEELKCIALVMHDPDDYIWVNEDGISMVQHAEVVAADARGFDISVSACDESSCWLTMVHARLPLKSTTAKGLFDNFDTICDRCLCDPPDTSGITKATEDILPEFYTTITNILNKDFLIEVNATITELAGVDSKKGEYISRISVDSVSNDGFIANVYFCNSISQSCSTMAVGVKFPRTATDADDYQSQLAQCLEDSTCFCGDIIIQDPAGELDAW
eukprot:CAMPEP_0173415960 /NCGR_PEP_ID=MMETSP1356-20130122/85142_1 /TAXON_ID=77927 ORGANISM="Hemiselmis virescens, Strain PCC157" /NCGR_SAMPLE_ID=MMETSP1356 /ASSEMBLY_ACC=CAM_ASM_000847 /LENGTH=394 /DNA_ID=CAMNT_0014378249 /DNA_START=92 /DNA_END=1272 /DNA_ORIENTATION=-